MIFFNIATKYGSFGGCYGKKIMFDVYFDSKRYSEQLFHSMSVPNMARLAVAKVVARVKIFIYYILT